MKYVLLYTNDVYFNIDFTTKIFNNFQQFFFKEKNSLTVGSLS